MSRVVVVGGGFAGMSAAARLAKLRHEVVLVEASARLGGSLHGLEIDGQRWSLHPEPVTLPGVFRDLFRKSGRAMDKTLGLAPAEGRRHVFADGTVLDLAMGQRGEQHTAFTAAFGRDDLSPWIDTLPDVWETMRRRSFDTVLTGPDAFDRAARRTAGARRSIDRAVRSAVKDRRARAVVLDPVRLAGLDPRSTPVFVGLDHYLERNFGRWRFDDGREGLAAALVQRLTERKVDVRTGTSAHRVLLAGGAVTGVETDAGTLDADVVVWCCPTEPAPGRGGRGLPVVPASRTLLQLAEDPDELAPETLVHGTPPLLAHSDSPGMWTVTHRSGEDALDALVRVGIDLRDRVLVRHDLKPVDLVTRIHEGWTWGGWGSMFDRPGVAPVGGLYQAGSHAHPGPRLEQIGMATAAIAADVGPAART